MKLGGNQDNMDWAILAQLMIRCQVDHAVDRDANTCGSRSDSEVLEAGSCQLDTDFVIGWPML